MTEKDDILTGAMELSHLGLARLDSEGRFVSGNAEYLSMLDRHAPDLIGQHWTVSVHPDDHARARLAYQLARANGRGYVEIRGLRSDSSIVYQALTISAITDERGVFTGYYCLRHNISGYKREQEALTMAVESAPNGFLMLNSSGQIRSVNRAVERLFGYSREELVGRSIETLLPDRFRGRHVAHREEFTSGGCGRKKGQDLRGLRKDGVEIPLEIYLNRIETDTGVLILCTVIDIADRVLYQQELEVAKRAAEAANTAKSDFLARMSHEIRTPMNLIMGMSALLLESPLNEKQRQHVEISHRNVRRLLRLINGILDLSKVEAGELTLLSVPFDLSEVIEECAATIAAAIERKGLELETSIDPDAGLYWTGDSERLQQVLLNLIGNSIKFTETGKIAVRVRPERDQDGNVGLRFEVTDTGCGIPPGKTAMIFEPFQQGEGAMNRRYEGTGLGLAIAKTLVELMNGRIWAEQKTQPGATVVFTAFLPPATEAAVRDRRSATEGASVMGAVAHGTRILLVEDNPENVILLQAYLENLRLSLDYASDGLEALEKRRRNTYDLVLMDIQMPVMDGYTATREIRAWEKLTGATRVPIVALTAHALIGAGAESAEAGCDGHLTKPVERNDLLEAIAKFAQHPLKPGNSIPQAIRLRQPAYLENRRLDALKMREALSQGDFATLRSTGHNCKGTGAGFGFPDIAQAGAAIEEAARNLDAAESAESIHRFELCLRAASH